jgi:hypothetical protein
VQNLPSVVQILLREASHLSQYLPGLPHLVCGAVSDQQELVHADGCFKMGVRCGQLQLDCHPKKPA